MKKLLITETDEIITFDEFLKAFHEIEAIGDPIGNLDYSIKHGIIKIINE